MPQSGDVVKIGTAASPASLSASFNISASAFYGDGSNLNNLTAEWDGTHNGPGEITGSFIITEALTLGTSNSYTHNISGSLSLYSGVVKVPTTNKLDVYGAIDGIHSSPQTIAKDMTLPSDHNGALIGPTVAVQVGKTITVGAGSILHILNPGL